MRFLTCCLVCIASIALLSPARGEIVVRDGVGTTVRLKAPATRIVALAPHIVEMLYAAGAGGHLVGAVDYSDHPPPARRLARVGGYSRIDLEAVVALRPDLVIAWESGNDMSQVDKLRALGLAVYVSQPNALPDIAEQIDRLGELAGTQASARAAAAAFRQRLAALRTAHAGKPVVRVFYQIWKAPLTTVGGPQIISDAISLCGGQNVFGHLRRMSPTVGVEAVLAADPEAIVATGMGDARPDWLHDWDRWTGMTAVRRGNLFHIDPDLMQRHTPRILDGTEKLCAALDVARSRRPQP